MAEPDAPTKGPAEATAAGECRVYLGLSMPRETFLALAELAAPRGHDLPALISRAFALYRAAAEARRDGKAVGIAPTPDALETEFVGF